MNPIEQLRDDLQARFPRCSFNLTPPLRPEDYWTLDILSAGRQFLIDYIKPNGFGFSELTEDSAFGRSDETGLTFEQILHRLTGLLMLRPRHSTPC